MTPTSAHPTADGLARFLLSMAAPGSPSFRGDFASLVHLQAAVKRYIAEHNDGPRPFAWTKPANVILNKITRHAEPAE